MELIIENIGKITIANIEINGITIIAGSNGTGKSTVSKSLFAMFNSFSNMPSKVIYEKRKAILDLIQSSPNYFSEFYRKNRAVNSQEFSKQLLTFTKENNIKKFFKDSGISTEFYEELKQDLSAIYNTPTDKLQKSIISEIFKDEFKMHIINILNKKDGRIKLIIKNNFIEVEFDENNKLLDFTNNYNLHHEIVYIDNPFIVDSYNFKHTFDFFVEKVAPEIKTTHRDLLLLQYNRKNNKVNEINIKEKLESIYEKIDLILSDELRLFDTDFNEEDDKLSIDSMSSGMKTFYLIKSLIENGTIVENGTVILDEPEVHLHPEWQIRLAEVIVLLQQKLKLHLLINTHSPYFVRAIEVYSKKYEEQKNVRYYLSKIKNERVEIENVTENISLIYKTLAKPLQWLEDDKYE